jgi:hypothetical protein
MGRNAVLQQKLFMGCLFLIFSVVCFIFCPPLGVLLFLIGIVLLLMGIAGNTSRANDTQRQIAASQSPQAILKTEILRCTHPAAQSVLEGKLQTLVQQEKEANARKTKITLIAGGIVAAFLFLPALFAPHTPQVTYTTWQPKSRPTPTPTPEDTIQYVKGPDGGWHAPTPTQAPTPYQMATPLPDYTPAPTPGVRRAQLVKRHHKSETP